MEEKIRVVHITETFVTGIYSYIKDISISMDNDDRFENIVIYSDNREGRINESFPQKTRLIKLDMGREINFKQDKKSSFELHKLLTELKPDVLHLHSSKAGFLGRFVAVFLKKKPKVYYTANGFSFLRTDISKTKQRFYYFLEKVIAKFSNSITIGCGDTEYEHAKKLGKAVLVRNGVDVTNLQKFVKPQLNATKLTVGILGRISAQRNPTFFNDLAFAFKDINFLWIGGGELQADLTAPNIKVTGWFTDKQEGYDFLNVVDIYLQTSLWEGLPIAVLEAMAFEKPVIASNVIGNKDAVVHGVTGYLFNNFEEACDQINKLKDDSNLRENMGQLGYKRCAELFDTNKNFKTMLELYAN